VREVGVLSSHSHTHTHTPVGGIVKTWKQRWFFLDAMSGQLRYYKPPESTELKVSSSLYALIAHSLVC
jgi:hypothetical protein